ncbi:MAG: DNA-formamidopyrimidine glycosylase family protein, partial [Gammaproteobacteria bacterium]
MPELPDIEVYLQALTARIHGATLNAARMGNAFFLRTAEPPLAAIMGQQVTSLQRVGKRLAFEFSNGHWLVMHLMIAGRLQWQPTPKPLARRQLAGFDFSTGTLIVTEAGTKRRAWLKVVLDHAGLHEEDPGGIEPLEMSFAAFKTQLEKRN